MVAGICDFDPARIAAFSHRGDHSMTLIRYTSRQLLAKLPNTGPFMVIDLDLSDIIPDPHAIGPAITTLAAEKLIHRCGDNPVVYKGRAMRRVWELTDLGRYHKQRGR